MREWEGVAIDGQPASPSVRAPEHQKNRARLFPPPPPKKYKHNNTRTHARTHAPVLGRDPELELAVHVEGCLPQDAPVRLELELVEGDAFFV